MHRMKLNLPYLLCQTWTSELLFICTPTNKKLCGEFLLWIIKREIGQDALLNASLQLKTNTPQAVGRNQFPFFFYSLFFFYSVRDAATTLYKFIEVFWRWFGAKPHTTAWRMRECHWLLSVSFIRPDNNTFVFENPPATLFHNDDNSTHNTSSCSAPGATAVCSYNFLLLKHTGGLPDSFLKLAQRIKTLKQTHCAQGMRAFFFQNVYCAKEKRNT